MNVAVTVWDGWISPVFDVSRRALVLNIVKGAVVSTDSVDLSTANPAEKIDRLVGLGVDRLICGAISQAVHREATCRGLEVIGFVAGETDAVVQAFLSGGLPAPELSMPGCCGRHRGGRAGRGRSRGGGRGRGRGSGNRNDSS